MLIHKVQNGLKERKRNEAVEDVCRRLHLETRRAGFKPFSRSQFCEPPA